MKEIASYRWHLNGISSRVFAMSDGRSRFVLFADESLEGIHYNSELELIHAFVSMVSNLSFKQIKFFK